MSTPATASTSGWWRSSRVRAAAALFGVLLIGIVLGAALDRHLLLRRLHGWPQRSTMRGLEFRGSPSVERGFGRSASPFDMRRMRGRLVRDLDLSAAQAAQVDSIISRRTATFRATHAETQARVRAMIDTTNMMIDSILTPAQREKFRQIRTRRAAERRARESKSGERHTP